MNGKSRRALNCVKYLASLLALLLLLVSCDATDITEESLSEAEGHEHIIDEPYEPIIDEFLWLGRFTQEEVWQMVADTDDMIQRVLGVPVDLHGADSLLIGSRYILASGTANIPFGDRIITQETDIFFLPQTADNEISLRIVAYDIADWTGLTMNHLTTRFNPESFFNPDEDTITVRFTRLYDIGHHVFYYVEEELSRETTIDEINRLLRLHIGLQVMDIWFCRDVCHWWRYAEDFDAYSCPNPNKLYIRIYPVYFAFFDWGSVWIVWERQLLDTFSSFPGVEEIQLLINGS